MSRYDQDRSIRRGTALGTARQFVKFRSAVNSGAITGRTEVVKEGQRLDQIAFREYNDGRLWWVIAAASGIGWVMQVPPGTVIVIPNIDQL